MREICWISLDTSSERNLLDITADGVIIDLEDVFVGGNESEASDFISIANARYDVTGDTKVLFVDSEQTDSNAGQDYTYGDAMVAAEYDSEAGKYVRNAFFTFDTVTAGDQELELLVLDVTSAFDGFEVENDDTTSDDDTTTGDVLDGSELTVSDLEAALKEGNVTVTGKLPAGSIQVTNQLTLQDAWVTGATTLRGDVVIDGDLATDAALTISNGSLTLNDEASVDNWTNITLTNSTITDKNASTAAADVNTMLTKADNVTVQSVTNALTTTDLSGKTLAVEVGDVDLSAVTTSDASTNVTVEGTATVAATADLSGTWTVGTLAGAGTSLTVSAGTTTIGAVDGNTLANVANVVSGATLAINDADATVTTVTANAGTLTVAGTIGTIAANTGTISVSAVPTTITASTGNLNITGNVTDGSPDVSAVTGTVTFEGTVTVAPTFATTSVLVFEQAIDLKVVFGPTIDGTNAGLQVTFNAVPTNLYVAAETDLTSESIEGAFVANSTTTPAITPVVGTTYTLTDSVYNSAASAAFVANA